MKQLFTATFLLFLVNGCCQTELQGVTVGIGTGFSRVSNTVYDYSLSGFSLKVIFSLGNKKESEAAAN
jgi:hypothetical protein